MSNLTKSIDLLVATKNKVVVLLTGDTHSLTLITVESTLQGLINKLQFMEGTPITSPSIYDHPPITNFMGEDLNVPVEITEEELEPTQTVKEIFIAKVDNLEANINVLSNQNIIDGYV